MGTYIGLTREDGIEEHPVHKIDKWSGNREFIALLGGSLTEEKLIGDLDMPWECDILYRPSDFTAFRAALEGAGPAIQDLHRQMVDTMEADPGWWFRVSW